MTHIVRQGECLSSIAHHYRLASWKVIYYHPNNSGFRAKRPNPNLIYPGDELYIPDQGQREDGVPTDKRHIFVVEFPPTFLNVRLQDLNEVPLRNAPYNLTMDALTLQGATNDDGWIRTEIPAGAEVGRLKVWPNPDAADVHLEWSVLLGHLDPIETTTGVKGRLKNLGYDCGEINDVEDEHYRVAVVEFQEDNGLTVDGVVGPQTRAALEQAHRI
jgi:Putative peptidoglycan binding domain